MSQQELNNLAKLSKKEKEVLGFFCQGLEYEEIEKITKTPVPTLKSHMGRVYVKLELDQLTKTGRIAKVHQVYCPLLKELQGAQKTPSTNPTAAPSPIPEEKPIPVPAAIVKMVEEDEYFMAHYKDPPVIIIPSKPSQKPLVTKMVGPAIGLVIGGGLCVCIAAVLIFLYWNQNRAQFTSPPNQPVSQPTQSQGQVINPTEPSQVIVVTATSLPESNTSVPAPTSGPAVVPTAIPAPVIPLPFSDNFDTGPSQYWKVLSGTWITADGRYTTTTPDTWSIVALDDPTWKNYHVHVNVKIPHIGSAAEGQIALFVRINTSPYLGFGDNALSKAYWGNQAQGGIYLVPIAGETKFYIQGNSNLDIEVIGNNFTARVDGQQVQKISMSGYETGGIALGIHCNTTLGCESFDNVTVNQLP